uniref:AlNc14C207G8837 protein n=1 Tax=Albugo laibachii Nc14 TaxID=890382 RepID=F0WR29_9STRA|nr:AlNc14C207G8837 [Albugo laibachii Nc14]|eukprot:CCA23789.1 AlNc14C207G8837 [Albugo laibachii Nc14]
MNTSDRHEVMKTVYELSQLLNTGLDRDTLAILMTLIQKGVNPEALAAVVKDLRKEARAGATNESKRSSNWAVTSHTSEESIQQGNKSKKQRSEYSQ